MPNFQTPWDQLLARKITKHLISTPITPNQITILSLFLAISGAGCLEQDSANLSNLGAGLFVLARFLDHIDGELARKKNMKSRLGYYLDYVVGGISYSCLFVFLGIKFQSGYLGGWAIVLGLTGSFIAIFSLFINLAIDNADTTINPEEGDSVGYPSILGFELEDGIYLIAPITWFGLLEFFFIGAGLGAVVYSIWTLYKLFSIYLNNSGI